MLKKILYIFLLLFVLSWCWQTKTDKVSLKLKDNNLPAISKSVNGILVSVSDSHPYSKKWPKLLSGSYYFNPRTFYSFNGNASLFLKSYNFSFDKNRIYYYDDVNGYNASIVVYVLRNIFHKKNVSLVINSKLKQKLKYNQKFYSIQSTQISNKLFTWWYIWTWKYLVVYNPNLVKFKTWDLILIPAYKIDFMDDVFYKKNKDKLNIKSIPLDNFFTFEWDLKPDLEIKKLISNLNLEKYKKVYIYYPRYWYKWALLALILDNMK